MSDPRDRDIDAAETALGLEGALTPDTLAEDAAAARWVERTAPLYDAMPAAPAPADLFARIESALARDAAPGARSGVWQSLTLWRTVAAASLLLAIGLASLLAVTPRPRSAPNVVAAPSRAPILTAALTGDAGEPGKAAFLLAAAPGGDAVRNTPATARPRPAGSYQLWALTAEGPIHLGLLSAVRAHSVPVSTSRRALLAPGARLIVTAEPIASVTETPGPVVASGALEPI